MNVVPPPAPAPRDAIKTRLQQCRDALAKSRHPADTARLGLLCLARQARQHDLPDLACSALLMECDRLLREGQHDESLMVSAYALRLARKASLPAWQACSLCARALALLQAGRHRSGLKAWISLLSDPALCAAMEPRQHAWSTFSVAALCDRVDMAGAALKCTDLAFAILAARSFAPSADFWAVHADKRLQLYSLSHHRLPGALPQVVLDDGQRYRLLQDAFDAMDHGLAAAEGCQLECAHEVLRFQQAVFAAHKSGSLQGLVPALVKFHVQAGRARRLRNWSVVHVIRVALALGQPDLARACLQRVHPQAGCSLVPGPDTREPLFLEHALALAIGDKPLADQLHERYATACAQDATYLGPEVQRLVPLLDRLLALDALPAWLPTVPQTLASVPEGEACSDAACPGGLLTVD